MVRHFAFTIFYHSTQQCTQIRLVVGAMQEGRWGKAVVERRAEGAEWEGGLGVGGVGVGVGVGVEGVGSCMGSGCGERVAN